MPIQNNVLNRIYSLSKMGIKLGLDNMEQALKALDLNISKIRFIHVAGTNGKGSTCAMLQKLILKGNKDSRVGLYTSPHLIKFNERIKINDSMISDEEIIQYANFIFEKCEHLPLTFFEFTTLMSFIHFIKNKVDFAVIETGMGGRMDATNIISPEICIITSVGMDHMEYLGKEINTIAMEKAGILKKNTFAIISDTEAKDTLLKEALKKDVKEVLLMNRDFYFSVNEDKTFNLHMEKPFKFNYYDLKKSLRGDHQYKNTSCAIVACRLLGINISEKDINTALETTSWMGRLQKFVINGNIIYLDVSHNVEGISATIKFLLEYHKNEVIHIACGFMKDKDYGTMISSLYQVSEKLFLIPTKVEERQIQKKDYESVIKSDWKNVFICNDYKDAFERIMKEKGTIIFTGSIFNFEEIYKLIEERQ